MERWPGMTSRPRAVMESVVGLFVPPLTREHVLGDLAERYTSAGQYLLEALRTVPAVAISHLIPDVGGRRQVVAVGSGSRRSVPQSSKASRGRSPGWRERLGAVELPFPPGCRT